MTATPEPDVLRFESLDDGSVVLAHAHAAEARVALAISHELDGDLELFMSPEDAVRLGARLAQAAAEAKGVEN